MSRHTTPLTLLLTDDHLLVIAVVLVPLGARRAVGLVRDGLGLDDATGDRPGPGLVSARSQRGRQTLGGRGEGGGRGRG